MNSRPSSEIRPESLQLVVGGQVPGVRYAGATFDFPTSEAYAVIQAHRPPDAPEPGSLVGEGEQKQERLVPAEVARLEAELRFQEACRESALADGDLMAAWFRRAVANKLRERIETERSRLATGGND